MHLFLQGKMWPATEPALVIAWYTLTFGVILALQLMEDRIEDPRTWRFALCLAAVLCALSLYTGRTTFSRSSGAPPDTFFESGAYFIPTVLIAWYVTLPFAQSWLKNGRVQFPYPDLFQFSWNNVLTIFTASLYTSLFWGSLGLWAAMFKILHIGFFAELFSKPPFIYLVTGTVFGFAVSINRSQRGLVANLRRTMLLIFQNLLPLPCFIALIFLATLPFTGLKLLWDTNHATLLMLNLQLYVVLFLNAVYQDGKEKPPYPLFVRRLVEAGVIVLPAYAALSAYALWLRVGQHGWSVSRVFAALAVFIAGLYVTGYAWAALKQETPWMKRVGPVNVRVAAWVIALAVLVNTPLMDPRLITVRSQIKRLLSGAVAAEKFDYYYLRFSLGKPGRDALVRLSKLEGHPNAETIRSRAAAALEKKKPGGNAAAELQTADDLEKRLKLFPEGKTFDRDFLGFLLEKKESYAHYFPGGKVLAVDLNRDQKEEYVLFKPYVHGQNLVFSRTVTGWEEIGRLISEGKDFQDSDFEKQLQSCEVSAPEWDLLRIGEKRYHVLRGKAEDPIILR